MKKFLKLLPYLIIICCVVFIALTLLKVDERADALTAQVAALETENANVTVSDKVASIDPATFYSEYLAACEAIAGEGQ